MKSLVAFDLDDTLMAERDFVDSAYRHIASSASSRYGVQIPACLRAMQGGENAFEALYTFLLKQGVKSPFTPKEMVEMYRRHTPRTLPYAPGAEQLLQELRRRGDITALITDGRRLTQGAKIHALGLERYIHPDDIFISEATGHDKHSAYNFERAQLKHPEAVHRFYIGDNPEKDFLWPRSLGWTTIAVRDSGRNIHPQSFETVSAISMPDFIIDSLDQAMRIIHP